VGYNSLTKSIVVAFRGSKNAANWWENMNFSKTEYIAKGCKDCHVHTGFLNTYSSIGPDMLKYVKLLKELHPAAEILVTGHSLGAALGDLCALDI